MERERSVPVQWRILLVTYFAMLFGSTMVVLTADPPNGPMLVLLGAGVPIYFLASRAIMSSGDAAHPRLEVVPQPPADPKIVPFPDRADAEATAEVVQAAGARTPRIRKLR